MAVPPIDLAMDEVALGFTEAEYLQSPDDLDEDVLPKDLHSVDTIEEVALMLGKFVAVSCLFSFGSDMLAQHLSARRLCVAAPPPPPPPVGGPAVGDADGAAHAAPYDWRRTGNYMATGCIFVGCAQFIRLSLIQKMFDPHDKTMQTVLKKTAINQFVMSPIVNAAAMFTLSYSRNGDSGRAWQKVKEDFCEAQMVAYTVKPVGNFLSFYFFPTNIVGQLVITRSIAFGYNTYFSLVAHREVGDGGGDVEEWIEEEGEEKWYWNSATHQTQWADPRAAPAPGGDAVEGVAAEGVAAEEDPPPERRVRVTRACGCSVQ